MPAHSRPDREDVLVSTAWLETHLADPELRIFDCTTYLRPAPPGTGPYRPESGRTDYDREHIPGAGFIDLVGELSDRTTALHFMMPPVAQFEAVFSRLGVGPGTRVILYSAEHIMWATRIWWMLRAMGFDAAAVLDGGFEKWKAEGRPLSDASCAYPEARFVARPRRDLFVDKERVRAALGDSRVRLINALNPDYHRGEGESRYGRPGRIPGSANVPARALTRESHDFVPLEDAAAKFAAAGVEGAGPIITYCGGGISATVDNFMLYRLGHDAIATYDASLGEWAQDASLPMERG